MNERWKDLMKQAIDEIGPEDKPSKEETLKRYAELIIQECCGIVLKNTNLHTYHRVKYEIKNHFGVE